MTGVQKALTYTLADDNILSKDAEMDAKDADRLLADDDICSNDDYAVKAVVSSRWQGIAQESGGPQRGFLSPLRVRFAAKSLRGEFR